MKIVIAGAGEVGTHLAKLLSKEGLDIILIDNDELAVRERDSARHCQSSSFLSAVCLC